MDMPSAEMVLSTEAQKTCLKISHKNRLAVRVLEVRIGLAGPYQQLQIEKWEVETGKINVDLRLHLLDQDQCVVGEA
jgi:hypothetical protein